MTARGETRLVCLDRRNGRERWTASSRSLPPDAGVAAQPRLQRLARRRRRQRLRHGPRRQGHAVRGRYVLAFDAATRQEQVVCYLASANTGWLDFGDFSGMFGQRVSHLAYCGGRLYAMTNLGALAAVDAYGGTIVWLNIYPRDVPKPNRMMGFHPAWNQRAPLARSGGGRRQRRGLRKPWTYNPVIVTRRQSLRPPRRRAARARLRRRHRRRADRASPSRQFDDADTLLGVVGERLVLASDKSVFCINWPAFDAARRAEQPVLACDSFAKAQYPDDAIRGRGFVTGESVIVPTAWALHRVALKDGRVEAATPTAPSGPRTKARATCWSCRTS